MDTKRKLHLPPGALIVSLAFLLSNLRATMFMYLHPDTSTLLSPAWIEIFFWLLILVLTARDISRNDLLDEFMLRWRENWALGVFIFLALLSTSWSIDSSVTLYRSLELLFATCVASYIGIRYLPDRFIELLFWFGVVLLIVCAAIVYSAPATGVMDWSPYNGAWRGIYWNRNHLASIAALLNAVFLCRLIEAISRRDAKGWLDAIFYIFALATLYFSRSATGFIVAIVLHIFIFCAWLWLQFHVRLQKRHYIALAGLALAGATLVLTNLDVIFGLFNRSTSLTGRVPLWAVILDNAVAQKPWLGHGFGAAWNSESFRVGIMQEAGWVAQPLISDNGYLEIVLHLGVSGLGIFLVLFFSVFVRSTRYGIEQKTLSGFFPLLFAIYALVANLSFSLFAETEVFVWVVLVAALFMTTQPQVNARNGV